MRPQAVPVFVSSFSNMHDVEILDGPCSSMSEEGFVSGLCAGGYALLKQDALILSRNDAIYWAWNIVTQFRLPKNTPWVTQDS